LNLIKRFLQRINRKHILYILFLFSFFQGRSQLEDSVSIYLHSSPKPMIKLNNRGSFVNKKLASVTGVVLGLSFKKRLKLGLSYNQVTSRIYKDFLVNNPADTFLFTLELIYVSGYIEYVYFYKKHWEISIPIQFGSGFSNYVYKTKTKTYHTNKHWGFIYEAVTDVVYKPVVWIGVGFGFGYRLLLFKELDIMKQFSSPIYSFGIKLYLSPVCNTMFGKRK